MARILITGSADGLGRAAAQTLLDDGHEVVVHARNPSGWPPSTRLVEPGRGSRRRRPGRPRRRRGRSPTRSTGSGRIDAVIHNAGVISGPHVMPVNVVAPYLLTALIDRPQRLVYLSSGMHRGGRADLAGLDWSGRRTTGSYSDSKLLRHHARRRRRPALARRVQQRGRPRLGAHQDGRARRPRRPAARSPDPGVAGHQRRPRGAHLAAATGTTSAPHPTPGGPDPRFQDDLLDALARFTGAPLA